MENKEKNSNTGFIIMIVVMAILLVGALGGMYLMMKETKSLKEEVEGLKESNDNLTEEDNTNDDTVVDTKCSSVVGKYYGELINDSLHMKKTYVFSEDGSYITYVEAGGVTSGTYTVTEGVINFIQKAELAPEDEKYTYSYSVSDDCKTIAASSDGMEYTLTLVEE